MTDATPFDHATWLAHRAIDARMLPEIPVTHVTLPGAKAAISHEHLLAYQAAGHDLEMIVSRVNDRWRRENADRLAEHHRWVSGPYTSAIEELRQEAIRKAARELERRARFEALIAERGDG